MPQKPVGLTDGEWAADLMDKGGTGRSPFDHVRCFKCAIGFHTECAGTCACPHHAEPTIAPLDAVNTDAVHRLCRLRSLPAKTGCRILAHAQRAAESGEASNANELREVLEDVYNGSPIGDAFLRDVLDCLDYSKVLNGKKGFR
jgi:hypothetical protein